MSGKKRVIDNFREIKLEKPSEIIFQQIKDLIDKGVLKTGDRLPPERTLSEQFNVSRGPVREAIKKLESYGFLKTVPQSGTFISNRGIGIFEGLICNILDFNKKDHDSLIESWALFEVQSAKLAAVRASKDDIKVLEQIHKNSQIKVEDGNYSENDDLLFHIKVAELCKNSIIKSLIDTTAPLIFDLFRIDEAMSQESLKGHEAIIKKIIDGDSEGAEIAMEEHIQLIVRQIKNVI